MSRFLDAMRPFAHNPELCLREFSKSLTNRAYVWNLNLKHGSIQDWDHLVTLFHAKLFCDEAKFTHAELGRTRQYPSEDMDVHVKRFRERALDCSDAVDEETLVDVCLYGMANEYRVYLENLTFPSFSKLMEAARRINESVRKPSRPAIDSLSRISPRSFPRKRLVITTVEEGRAARPPRPKKPSFRQNYKTDNRQGKKPYLVLPPFLCGIKKALVLLNQRVK